MPRIIPLPARTRNRSAVKPIFAIQFPVQDVPKYAALYEDDDSEVLPIGRSARERGYYTRDEFIAVCYWKTPRTKSRVQKNSVADVETATRTALSNASSEDERIGALLGLHGVGWPT